MHPAKRIILPHDESGERAHAINTPALSLYVLFIAVSVFTFQFLTSRSGLVLGYATDIKVEEIVNLTNAEREKAGLGTLSFNEKLSAAAKNKAEDMFEDDYWAHIARDGTTPWVFIENSGYDFFAAGENLARDFNDSEAVVRAWMNSPSHKDNVLGASYKDIGVAVVNGDLAGSETTLVVQMFGITRHDQQLMALAPTEVEVTPEAAATAGEGAPVVQTVPMPTEESVIPSAPESLPIRSITRTSSLLFIAFLLLLFALDLYVVAKKKLVRVSGNTFAHLSMLVFILIVIWWVKGGLIV